MRLPPLVLVAAALASCAREPRVRIDYTLGDGVTPDQVVRVETIVRVAPADPRVFFADQAFRVVAQGVGYEVRDFDGNGVRSLLITHDATLGYVFQPTFSFTLLPPVGDPPPLSIEARAVGASATIGHAAPVDAVFGPSTEVSLLIVDQRCGAAACSSDQACCGGGCATVLSDVANCGDCGQACAQSGDSCSGGLCRCQGGSACTAGSTCCAGIGCVQTDTDPYHCGGCGKACAPGESCTGGACHCGTQTCSAGQLCCVAPDGTASCATSCPCGLTACTPSLPLCCNGVCKDPQSPNSCGSCDVQCGAATCKDGSCLCNGTTKCQAGDTCCPSGCASVQDDPLNCGGCGRACGSGSSCVAGQCVCGKATCSGSAICCGGVCVDPTQSVTNCGGCDVVCNQGELCKDSKCVCEGTGLHCTGTSTCCPNQGCFDVASDPAHCGRSCTDCGATNSCVNGVCQSGGGCAEACAPGTRCCASNCVNIDDHHCSSCTDDCTVSGQKCCLGTTPKCSVAGLCAL